ncbi:Tbingi protein, partial [Trypanosoma grayi]|uniref:Tbingi protein n=1 Tax=Trypanosoma grayi TaxID=71804 RepID=UPI0004F40390
SGIRLATKAAVPEGNRRQSPFWTPELADLDKAIASKPHAQSSQRLKIRRRELLRTAATSRWRTLCSNLEASNGTSWKTIKRLYAPSPPQHTRRQRRLGCAFPTPKGQPPGPHERCNRAKTPAILLSTSDQNKR